MDDDLNLPEVVCAVSGTLRDVNQALDIRGGIDLATRDVLRDLIRHVDDTVGVLPLVDQKKVSDLPSEMAAADIVDACAVEHLIDRLGPLFHDSVIHRH
jgi:hypothetical protein